MSDYQSRKAARIVQFERTCGVKMINCMACDGSGHYDHDGSPPCGSCAGTGRERAPLNVLPSEVVKAYSWRERLRRTEQIRAARRTG